MLDVLPGLVARQGFKVVAPGYALRQLPQVLSGQQVAQFGLANQDDLQQLLFCRLQVGQQSHLFEHVARQVLCLVDDEYDAPPLGMRPEQLLVEAVDQCFDTAPVLRGENPEFLADGLEKLDDGEARVQDDRDIGVVRELVLQQRANEGGLAGPDFAGELHEAAALGYPVDEVSQRLAMAFAKEQVTRVRRYRERLLIESEETRIHD